jgi:hypothetical protein
MRTILIAALLFAVSAIAPAPARAIDFSFVKDNPIAALIALPALIVTAPFMAGDWLIAKINDARADDDDEDEG